MSEKAEIRSVYRKMGMEPEKIRYNGNLDRYCVDIGVEDTDDSLLHGVDAFGSEKPVDTMVDTTKLGLMENRIQGAKIPSGTINVIDTMRDEHFLVEIV